ncbi:MAG: AN1-type zinc finger domain-containing protein [Candidatus Hodarchaeota archaeon]
MSNCHFCKGAIKDIPYRCKFCGMIFCNKHRLPENHDCPFDLRKKDKDYSSLNKTLYQDALEFMSKDLTVAKIYDYVKTSQMTKSEAIELLSYFLEKSDKNEIRKVSILAFKVLNLKNDKVYNVLENCILSDENSEVKKTAMDVIKYNFPKRSRNLLNWINKNKKDLEKD